MPPVEGMHWQKVSEGDVWTKGDVVANNRLKLELFRRFGVLPGASDTHIAEFFPGFVTQASDFGRDWGVHHYGLHGHQKDKEADDREVRRAAGRRRGPAVAVRGAGGRADRGGGDRARSARSR